MARYVLIDTSGTVVAWTEWNGGAAWQPPAGQEAIPSDSANVGDTYANGVFTPAVAPAQPAPTATQEAAAALAVGLAVTSTGAPALDGTYSLNQTNQNNVNATVTYILLNGTFPGGGTTMPWIDQNGDAHVFQTIASFKAFATAFANYVAAVALYAASNGTVGSLPSNAVTIA